MIFPLAFSFLFFYSQEEKEEEEEEKCGGGGGVGEASYDSLIEFQRNSYFFSDF